jgi:Uma2 family endonuclease
MQERIPLSYGEDSQLSVLPALPTMYDLPSEDPEEHGLPDDFHDLQPQLLSRTLRLSGYNSQEIYTASDLNLYYDLSHLQWYKRPDWFLVVGVPRLYPGEGDGDRESYVIWQEKVSPIVIVEFLSPGTEADDLGRFAPKKKKESAQKTADPNAPPSKFEVYEKILKVPHYIVFNKRGSILRYFQLIGDAYQEQEVATDNPRIWIADLGVGLALWQGIFEGMPKTWLRWCDANGTVLLTDTETALQGEAEALKRQQQAELQREQAELEREQAELEREQAKLEREQAELEREQAELKLRRTVLSLHEIGMTIAQVAQITGLTEAEVEAIVQS